MEIRDSEMSLVFLILYICKMKKNMKEKNQVVPDEVLSKEFISQFKTEADVSKFLKQLHAQVLEKMLEGEMDAHLGYEKNSAAGNNTGNSRNGSYPKKIQTEHGEAVISIPRDRNGQFEPTLHVCHFHHYKQGKSSGPRMAEPSSGPGLSDSLDGRYRLQGTG